MYNICIGLSDSLLYQDSDLSKEVYLHIDLGVEPKEKI